MTQDKFREVLENTGKQEKRVSLMANVTDLWRRIFKRRNDEKTINKPHDVVDDVFDRINKRSGH